MHIIFTSYIRVFYNDFKKWDSKTVLLEIILNFKYIPAIIFNISLSVKIDDCVSNFLSILF